MLTYSQIKQYRQNIRRQRRNLSRFSQRHAQLQTSSRLLSHPHIKNIQHIGIYLNAFGEIPTHELIMEFFKRGKTIYLPVICAMNQKLVWQKISFHQFKQKRWALHRLGMQQPMPVRANDIRSLDVVIMPLVIFDTNGHRVGMGGGFYDRTLADAPRHPFRIGLAYDFQQADDDLEVQIWDQSLDMVVTPTRLLRFRR